MKCGFVSSGGTQSVHFRRALTRIYHAQAYSFFIEIRHNKRE